MQQAQHSHQDNYAIAFSRGDEQALAWFFQEYYASLCIVAGHYVQDMETAKEIVSEAFYKIWQYRAQFTKAASIRAYLYTIVKNDSTRCLRQRSRLGRLQHAFSQTADPVEENVFDVIVKAETARHLHKAISTLPPQCRKIFELMYIKGKTVPQVAKELKLAPSTVRAQKVRGLDVLRRIVIPGIALLLCWFFL